MLDGRWNSWEKDNKFEAEEWEHHAAERCEMFGEEWLGHYFEPRMCLKCFRVEMFSIMRTKKIWPFGETDQIVRRWCTGCGEFASKDVTRIGKRYATRNGRRLRGNL